MNKFSFLKVIDVLFGIGKLLDIEFMFVVGVLCFKLGVFSSFWKV